MWNICLWCSSVVLLLLYLKYILSEKCCYLFPCTLHISTAHTLGNVQQSTCQVWALECSSGTRAAPWSYLLVNNVNLQSSTLVLLMKPYWLWCITDYTNDIAKCYLSAVNKPHLSVHSIITETIFQKKIIKCSTFSMSSCIFIIIYIRLFTMKVDIGLQQKTPKRKWQRQTDR